MRLVRFTHEHRPAFRIRVERDRCEPGLVLGVVLAYGMDEAHGRLTAIHDGDAPKVLASHLLGPERGFDRIDVERLGGPG